MYLMTKSVLAVMLGFIIAVVLGLVIIPLLKKLKFGQRVSAYVGDAHLKKEGTPTMGGLIFIISTLITIAILLSTGKINMTPDLGIVLLVFLGYSVIGFADDFLSIKRGKNDGLSISQKLFFQLVLALLFFYIYLQNGGQTSLVISTLGINIEMGWFFGVFILFILIGGSNAVNITDGLDGLAGGLSAIAFVAFALISLVSGFEDMGVFTFILTGALFGFLTYNGHPAKVFMGDTGSLALGGVMASIAIITHREITLLIVAGVFVFETISVILQLFWIKVLHRKLFLMAPIHHHFEKLGWNEVEIVRLFWTVGLILAMAGIFFGVWL